MVILHLAERGHHVFHLAHVERVVALGGVRAEVEAGRVSVADAGHLQAEDEGGGATLSDSDKLKLEQINELLDEEVRPFLQGDGGDLYVVGLEGSTLKVHYQGACGTCPSSISGTLAGIEGLVRRIDPEMEVIAV